MTGIQGRVLVTGADGFIGSHLVERLVADGCDVRALALYNPTGSYGWLEDLAPDVLDAVDVRLGDVRDPRSMDGLCADVDVVFHLAALISIPYSYEAPRSYFDVNLGGTVTLLESALRAGVGCFVHTSTSEVYGTAERLPITEEHPLQGQSPYSASKIAADMAAMAWSRSFGLPVATVRPFNTYGPRQSTRAVIPALLTQLLAGDEARIGDLRPRRDFTYVTDTVDGFVRAATSGLAPGEVVQLGTGSAVTIGELAELAGQALGKTVRLVEDAQRLRPPDSEVWHLLSDPSKARRLMAWEPTVTLREGLARTADWLRESQGGGSTRFYT